MDNQKQNISKILSVESILALIVCISLLLLSASGVMSSFGNMVGVDSNVLLAAAEGRITIGEGSRSYFYMAKFYALFPPSVRTVVPLIVAVIVLSSIYLRRMNLYVSAVMLFILFPNIILSMPYPQKEVLTHIIFSLLLILFFRDQSTKQSQLMSCLLIFTIISSYGIYAYYIRSYYFIIMAVFIGILVLIKSGAKARLLLVAMSLLVFLLIPIDVLQALQGPRDSVNEIRMARMADGSRTAFVNLLEVDSHLNFLINYFYAGLRLTLPAMFHLGFRELFGMFYAGVCYFYALYPFVKRGLRNHTSQIWSALVLSHILVLWLFEPDLGSYMRHLSNVAILLLPAIALNFSGSKLK